MRPSSEARFGVGILLALQLATSAAGVVLLGRMSPAVDRILRENVYSTQAVEEMLAILALDGEADAFRSALDRARGNVTEPEEVTLLDALDAEAEAAVGGGAAREAAVQHLVELGEINRQSMRRADAGAQSLGLAGAWAMTLLGFASFLANLLVFRRIKLRLLRPILEVDGVLAAARSGDPLRRCALDSTSAEGGRLMANLNWLLDRRTAPGQSVATGGDEEIRAQVLRTLLDGETERVLLVVGAEGRVIALNQLALQLGQGPTAWSPTARAIASGQVPEGWVITEVDPGAWVADGPPDPPPIP